MFGLSIIWEFAKKYWIYIVVAVVTGLVIYGIYHQGQKAGFAEGVESRNAEVKGLKEQITARDGQENKRVKDLNTRIGELEAQSAADAQTIREQKELLANKQQGVIVRYVQNNPQVATQCAWSVPTVQAIRDLLGAHQ